MGCRARTRARSWALVVVIATIAAAGPTTATAAPPGARVRSGPLHDVVAIGPADVWAVGGRGTVTHWDGATWQTQRLGGMRIPTLTAVDAVSSNDVWAVGGVVAYDQLKPYLTHWDGSGWTRTAAPAFPGEVRLLDVVAVSATQAWAVGSTFRQSAAGGRTGGIALRWTGSRWRSVHLPPGVALSGVALVHGVPIASGERVGTSEPVIARRLAGAWRIVPTPEPPGRTCTLSGITGAPPAAAGTCTSGGPPTPYVVARDAGSWGIVPAGGMGALFDVGGGPVAWAVGCARPSDQPLTLRRRPGGAWTQVTAPHVSGGGTLEGVDVRAFADAWAVGWRRGTGRAALVLHWDGAAWTVAPAP